MSMWMSRRRTLAAGSAALSGGGAVGLASCAAIGTGAGAGDPGAHEAAKREIGGTVEIVTATNLTEFQNSDAPFRERYPGTKLAATQPPPNTTIGTLLIGLSAAGTPPDLVQVNNDDVASFSKQSLIAPLDALMKRDARDVSDYYPLALKAYAYEGKQPAMPLSMNPVGLYVNRTLFETAGVPLPARDFKSAGWTLDELLSAAQRLTRATAADDKPQFGVSVDDSILRWFPFLWDNGGDAFDNPDAPKKFTFVSPETERTLQWLVDLKYRHRVAPQPADLQGTNAGQLYQSGQIAMRVDICSAVNTIARVEGLKWDVVAMPRGPKGRFTRLAGTGLGMHPRTKNRETAWAFVKWYSGPESPRALSERPTALHPIRSARESRTFMAWLPAEVKRAWFETLEYGRYQAAHPKWQELMGADGAQKHYEAALRQQVSVRDALEGIRRHAEGVLASG